MIDTRDCKIRFVCPSRVQFLLKSVLCTFFSPIFFQSTLSIEVLVVVLDTIFIFNTNMMVASLHTVLPQNMSDYDDVDDALDYEFGSDGDFDGPVDAGEDDDDQDDDDDEGDDDDQQEVELG